MNKTNLLTLLGILLLAITPNIASAQWLDDGENGLNEDQQIEMLQNLLDMEDISEELNKIGINDPIANDFLDEMTYLIHNYNFGDITSKLKRDYPGVKHEKRDRMESHIYPTNNKIIPKIKDYDSVGNIYSEFLDRQIFLYGVSALFEFVQNEIEINEGNVEILTNKIMEDFEESSVIYISQDYDSAYNLMKNLKGELDFFSVHSLWEGKQVINSLEQRGLEVGFLNDKFDSAKEETSVAYFENILNIKGLDDEFITFVRDISKNVEKRFGDEYVGVDYITVKAIITEINYTAEQIIRIENRFEEVDAKLIKYSALGVETFSSENYLLGARNSFEDERYDESESSLSKANSELELELTKLAVTDVLAKEGKGFIKRNSGKLIFILFSLIVFGPLLVRKIRLNIINNKLQNKQLERKILFDLTKKAQIDRFQHGSLDDETYNIKLDKYMEGISHIKSILPVLEDIALRLKEKTKIEKFYFKMKEKFSKRRHNEED